MMIIIIKGICIITIILTAISCDKNFTTSQYEKGIEKALVGRTSSATKSFIRSLKDNNKPSESLVSISVLNKLQNELINRHSSYYFFSALSKFGASDFDGARQDIDIAVSSELNFSEALILRALISAEQRDYNSVLEDYSKVVAINPDKFNFVYNEIGSTNAYLGNFNESIKNFERAIKNDPRYEFAYFNMANTKSILNMQKEAIDLYSKALSIDPGFYEALFFRANTYLDIKDYKNAIKDYSEAIKLKPKFAMAYINRGVAYTKNSGSHKKALKDYSQAIKIYPWYGLAYYNRGVSNSFLGNFEEAIADYTTAIDQDPWYTKAEVIWNKKESNNKIFSKIEYEKHKTADPNTRYGEVKSNRGVVYIYKGISDTVVSDFDKANGLYPWYAMAYYNRATAYARSKKYDKAIEDYNKALEINPGDPEILGKRALAYLNDGKTENAKEDIRIAREMGYEPDKELLDTLNKQKSSNN